MTTTDITNYLKSVKQYFYDCPNAELSLEIVKDLITIILQLLQEKEG